ncbi:MAG: peptidylprolyl isomerase [bacterium]|nr:peptidylprolyl isomerase [bacterium]
MRRLNKSLRYLSVGAIMLCTSVMIAGCSSKGKDKDQNADVTETLAVTANVQAGETSEPTEQPVETEELKFDSSVLKVGNEDVTYREALIYILQIKNKYEPSLGSEIWSYQLSEDETFADKSKQEIIDQITQIKIVKQQAEKLGISLEADETAEVAASTTEYMSKITKEDQARYGITEEMVQKVLEENYLAQKVYNIATNEVDTNISDDAAKQIKVQIIQVMTEGEDKNGNKIDMNEEQKNDAKSRADKLKKQADKEKDFLSFASSNSDASIVELTFGKGDYPEFEQQAFSLKQGQISSVIETSTGYVILKLVSAFDEDATKGKKEEIIEEERDKVFQEKYKIWSGDYKATQDVSKWDIISFNI